MKFQRIELINGKENVWLDCYIADPFKVKRKALLVIPGGGYENICSDREGEPIALSFMPYGFNAFVLRYSVGEGKATYPQPLIEASVAIKAIKDNAEEYGIDPEYVFAVGFSAGGHLCTALGTMWHLDEVQKAIPDMHFGYNKPAGIIPVYPVISSDSSIWHKGSFDNIVGDDKSQEAYDKLSVDRYVDKNSSPAFIVHTFDDNLVPVRNSVVLADAYSKANVPFELHIFHRMGHGMATADKITNPVTGGNAHNAHWIELAAEWMDDVKK